MTTADNDDPTLAQCCALAEQRCMEAEEAMRLAHMAACNDDTRPMELLLRDAIGQARALHDRIAMIASCIE